MSDKFTEIEFSKIRWIIIFSYLIGLVLNIISSESTALAILPPFTLLLALFWTAQIFSRTHLTAAFILGLLNDVIFQTLLGSHALIFTIIVFILLRLRIRFATYPLMKQSLTISLLMYLYLFLHYVFYQPTFSGTTPTYYLLMPLTSLIIWPSFNFIYSQLTYKVTN